LRILIDTNILINLEDNKVLEEGFSLFLNRAHSNDCSVMIHGSCLDDISKDKDENRKEIILSKLKKYPRLENPAKLDQEFSNLVGQKKDNDRIDNEQLLQVHKGYVELFVTNDKGIQGKAEKLGIRNKTLSSKEALSFLDEKYTLKIPSHPVLEHVSLRELEKDFDSPFFETLKLDYDPIVFMKWIHKCAKEDRKCYALRIESELSAILIYNVENANDHGLGFNGDAIKMCTFKVGDDALGLKLGELFINKMFEYCINHDINYLYVTTYDKQHALIHLLTKFGFDIFSEFENNVGNTEFVFLKNLDRNEQQDKGNNSLHPFLREAGNKFIVPIQPQFYQTLFKDGNLRTPSLFDGQDYGLQEVQGNTIVKAYISKSSRQDLVAGDLLFFYSSQNYKSLEPVGVLIEHTRVDNFEDLWDKVRSKTVYSPEHLKQMFEGRKYLTVTIFRLVTYLNPIVNFNKIKTLNAYNTKFQTITKLGEEDYANIKNDHLDLKYLVN
jgi:rRNA-processing protein FCF1